jgi:hypothetical protein
VEDDINKVILGLQEKMDAALKQAGDDLFLVAEVHCAGTDLIPTVVTNIQVKVEVVHRHDPNRKASAVVRIEQ